MRYFNSLQMLLCVMFAPQGLCLAFDYHYALGWTSLVGVCVGTLILTKILGVGIKEIEKQW